MEIYNAITAPNGMPMLSSEYDNVIPAHGIYLHGDIENEIGNDLFFWSENVPKNGIHFVNVKDSYTEISHMAIAYIWNVDNRLRGLIVSPFDKDSINYAIECMATSKSCL